MTISGDGRWATYAQALWQEMEGLLTEEGRTPPGADRVRALFRAHMPELVPVLDRLAGQLDRPGAEAFLTHAALRPFTQSCTQISRNGTLLRNYDLRPDQCEGTIAASCYLRPVIGMQDMLWGLLDGMNDAGLAVSLTWGGRSAYGRGFAILILVRYLLETCDTVDEAVDGFGDLLVVFRFAEKSFEIRVAIGIEQAEPREVAFRAELLGRGRQQQQAGRFSCERLDQRILRARSRRRPFEVVRFIDDQQIPARRDGLRGALFASRKESDAANHELAVEEGIHGLVAL